MRELKISNLITEKEIRLSRRDQLYKRDYRGQCCRVYIVYHFKINHYINLIINKSIII